MNIEARYQIVLYQYDPATNAYQEIKQNYQLENYPYTYRIDLASLAKGTYVFGIAGAEWDFGNATGLYNLRISIPTPELPGKVINGSDNGETLTGGGEENTINGKGGADILNGRAGDDTLNGGSGIDRVVEAGDLRKFILSNGRLVGNGVDVLVSVEQTQLTGGDSENTLDASVFTLGSVANLNGGGDDDTLLGGSKNDSLTGGDGFDYLDGGAGSRQDAGRGRRRYLCCR